MSHTITNTNNTANNSYPHQYGSILTSAIGTTTLGPTEQKHKNEINLKIIPAVGGFILEIHRLEDILLGPSNVKRYILREKNMGKQIERILSVEILRK
jgi:hypothetical protein